MEIARQKRRLDRFPQFDERAVGGMLHIGAGKATQDGLRLSGAHAQGRGVLDHIVILLADQRPVDGLRQNRLQVGVSIDVAGIGPESFCAAMALRRGMRSKPNRWLNAKAISLCP